MSVIWFADRDFSFLVPRLLKETGRYSNSPIFVVGIFSGADKLGEGFGSSLKMAEYRAAEDSLHRLFLTRTPENLIQLPSSTFSASRGDMFTSTLDDGEVAIEGAYEPSELPDIDLMYASSGRSKVMIEGRKPSSS
jgi:large subunit ribosomal protein L44